MDEVEKMARVFTEALEMVGNELTSLPPTETTGREVLAATLLCRLYSNLDGLRLMYEAKLLIEAATLVRTALDTTFMLGASIYDPEIGNKLQSQDNASRTALAKSLLASPAHRANLSKEEIKGLQLLAQNSKPEGGKKRIEVEDMAEHARMPEWYAMYLRHSNFAAHASAASLEKHLRRNAEGKLIGFDCAPQNSHEWFMICGDGASITFRAWQFLDELFPKSKRPSLDPLLDRHNEMLRVRLGKESA